MSSIRMSSIWKRLCTALLIAALLLLPSCAHGGAESSPGELTSQTNIDLLGTVITVSLYEPDDPELFTRLFALVEDIDTRMTAHSDSSELALVNDRGGSAPTQISTDLYQLIQRACEMSDLTDGAFDVTIGPVMELWRPDVEFSRLPALTEIEARLPLVDHRQVSFSNGEIALAQPGMMLDLGGIAKGYACDTALDFLKEQGIASALLDFGGNIYAHGTKADGSPWRIGIAIPLAEEPGNVCAIGVQDRAVVTSGGYERYFVQDGTTYHHILNPKTGYPAENELLSVTIVDTSATRADALSTACFVLGLQGGSSLLEGLPSSEGIFITKDYTVYVTSGLSGAVTMMDERFTLAEQLG